MLSGTGVARVRPPVERRLSGSAPAGEPAHDSVAGRG
jgi:hypothetical protein